MVFGDACPKLQKVSGNRLCRRCLSDIVSAMLVRDVVLVEQNRMSGVWLFVSRTFPMLTLAAVLNHKVVPHSCVLSPLSYFSLRPFRITDKSDSIPWIVRVLTALGDDSFRYLKKSVENCLTIIPLKQGIDANCWTLVQVHQSGLLKTFWNSGAF